MLVLLASHLPANEGEYPGLSVTQAWVKAPMPGMMMTAAYFELTNEGVEPITLIGVKTSFSKVSELHDMVMEEGVMQMRHADAGWVIKAGAQLSLTPGGKHAMLMGLHENLKVGQEVMIELNFAGIGWMPIMAQVSKMKP